MDEEDFQPEAVPNVVLQEVALLKLSGCISNVIEMKEYSNLNKLLRVTAMVIRFINNCRGKAPKKEGCMDSDDKGDAMRRWIKVVQANHFKEEIKALMGNKKLYPILERQLNLSSTMEF